MLTLTVPHSRPTLYQLSRESCLAPPLSWTWGQPRFLCGLRKLCGDKMCNWLCLLGTSCQLSQLWPARSPDPPVFNNVGRLTSLWHVLVHHHSDYRGAKSMSRPPPSVTPPRPRLLLPLPPASCITAMYKLRLHSSSPHSPALLFVLLYIFHVKNLMLQIFFS